MPAHFSPDLIRFDDLASVQWWKARGIKIHIQGWEACSSRGKSRNSITVVAMKIGTKHAGDIFRVNFI